MRRLMLILAALSPIAAGPARAAVTCPAANTIAARSSGTAPLFVFFDASGTNGQYTSTSWAQDSTLTATANQSFRDLNYQWNFNDPNSGTWGDQGYGYADHTSRNTATGPVSAHLFETAGTYQPTLTITNTAGQSCSVTFSPITVTAANTTWTGTATECIAASTTPVAGAGGCPAGAAVLQQSVFETAMSSAIASGARRILFNGGDTFTATGGYDMTTAGPGYVGSYGTGQATVSIGAALNTQPALGFQTAATDWRVVGINWTGTDTGSSNNYNAAVGGSNRVANHTSQITMLRNKVTAGFEYGALFNDFNNNGDGTHDQVGMIENNFTGLQNSGQNCSYAFFGGIHHGGIIGNSLDLSPQTGTCTSHVIRVVCAKTALISHNFGRAAPDGATAFRIEGGQNDSGGPQCAGGNVATGGTFFWLASDNNWIGPTIRSGANVTSLNTQEGSAVGPEYGHDGIEERDFITMNNPSSCGMVTLAGQRTVFRNNILNIQDLDTTPYEIRLWDTTGVTPISNIEIYNNTAFFKTVGNGCGGGGSGGSQLVGTSGNAPDRTTIRNNLAYDQTGKGLAVSCVGTNCAISNNLSTGTNPFASSTPAVATDFKLLAGSAPVGVGTSVGEPPSVPVQVDFGLNPRPSPTSVGAWDVTGTLGALGALGVPGQPLLMP